VFVGGVAYFLLARRTVKEQTQAQEAILDRIS
jgi:preprotein translocase subunit YajC